MLGFYTKFVVQRCIVCCDRRHLDKSTTDYIRNTDTRGGRKFVTLVTSTPQQMYVILRIYQYLYISELQIFSRLSMHNIKITATSKPTHSKPPAIFEFLWGQPESPQPCIAGDVTGPQWLKWHIQFIYAWIVHYIRSWTVYSLLW